MKGGLVLNNQLNRLRVESRSSLGMAAVLFMNEVSMCARSTEGDVCIIVLLCVVNVFAVNQKYDI